MYNDRQHVQYKKTLPPKLRVCPGSTTAHLKTGIGASIQSYGLHELQNSIKHHPQNDDSNFRLL